MDHTYWILIFGGIFAFLNAFAVGTAVLDKICDGRVQS